MSLGKKMGVGLVLLLAGLAAVTWYEYTGTKLDGGAPLNGFPWGSLPPGASTITPHVDRFYHIIFWVTTVTFFLVEGTLLLFLVKYRRRPGVKPVYSHGSRTAEIVWTAIPGFMLLALALGQTAAWAKAKTDFPTEKDDPVKLQILAQQFNFQMRYNVAENPTHFKNVKQVDPEDDSISDTLSAQEIYATDAMFVPVNKKALISLSSADVIHSLFIPHMRVKQDAVPGMTVRVYFEPERFFLVENKPNSIPKEMESKIWPRDKTHTDQRRRVWVDMKDFEKHFADKKIGVNQNPGNKADYVQQGKITYDGSLGDVDFFVGRFDVACAELCGAQHFAMNSALYVGTQEMFTCWLTRQTANGAPKVWPRWNNNRHTSW